MVSVSIIAMIVAIMIPSVRSMRKSYESTGATSMINSALASARAIAIKEHKYAGIRFQLEYAPNKKLFERSQYMVFIVSDLENVLGITGGFKAVQGLKPMKLPGEKLILDLAVRTNYKTNPVVDYPDPNQRRINDDQWLDEEKEVIDATSFSIIFSPSGRLVTQNVRMRNKEGIYRPDNGNSAEYTGDIFNSPSNIENYKMGLLVQDDYGEDGLGAERSKNEFCEISKEKLRPLYEKGQAWSEYLDPSLKLVESVYINAYTGEIIKNQ